VAPRKIDREISDRELTSLTLEGDLGAFEVLVKRHQGKVMTTACRILGNMESSREASQEVFMRVYQYLSSFDTARSFSAWLNRIAVNVCFDKIKQEKKMPKSVLFDEMAPNGHHRISSLDGDCGNTYSIILSLVDELPFRQRTAFVLRDVEGHSVKEISDHMDCPETTVRSHLHHARLKLRNMLLRRYPELVEGFSNEM
jgi:RNA polymerase sigma-70 factor (ECF subfamily)